MSKQKTPLQQAIYLIDKSQWDEGCDKSKELALLKSLLPAERQAIEQAYMSGLMDGVGAPMTYKSKSDYFAETYEI